MLPEKFFEVLEAVVYIGLNSSASPVSGKEVCEAQGLSPRHLEKYLQILVHKNILVASKGAKGGYALAKEKRKITADKIYTILLQNGTTSNNEIINKLKNNLSKNIEKQLEQITIEELCRGQKKNKKYTSDPYSI